jgi:hypothetical protein
MRYLGIATLGLNVEDYQGDPDPFELTFLISAKAWELLCSVAFDSASVAAYVVRA